MDCPVDDRLGRHRSGDAIALGDIAAQAHQQLAMLQCLQPLGDDLAAEGPGQADHRAGEGQVVMVMEDVAHE
ncbi:hypothetical protein D3C77_680870 [compost metagenome]